MRRLDPRDTFCVSDSSVRQSRSWYKHGRHHANDMFGAIHICKDGAVHVWTAGHGRASSLGAALAPFSGCDTQLSRAIMAWHFLCLSWTPDAEPSNRQRFGHSLEFWLIRNGRQAAETEES